MSSSQPSILNKLIGNAPLRTVLIVPFVLQIIGAVGIVGYLSFRNGQKAVNDLASQLRTEVSSRITQHLDSQLKTARQLAEINGDAVDLGLLDYNNYQQLGQFFGSSYNSTMSAISVLHLPLVILRVLGIFLMTIASQSMKFLKPVISSKIGIFLIQIKREIARLWLLIMGRTLPKKKVGTRRQP